MIVTYAILWNVSSYLYSFGLIPNNHIQRYYYCFLTGIEFLSFSFFIFLHLKINYLRTLVIYISIAFFFFLVLFTFFVTIPRIDSVPIGVETIIILVLCIFFLFEQINHPENLFIYHDYRFWIIIAFMFYLSGSFFIFIFGNQIPKDQMKQIWPVTFAFNALKNILFSVGILVLIQQPLQKGPDLSLKSYSEPT